MAGRRPEALLFGPRHWYRQYPVAYAEERLTARGAAVAPVLLDVTRDPHLADVHFVAWRILGRLIPPTYLKEVHQAGREGRLSAQEVSGLVELFLPIRRPADYWQPEKVMDWLGRQLADKTFDQIVLDEMDAFLKVSYAEGGMYPGLIDERVLRWLNRAYDVDLGAWLADKAPAVLEFRRAQLVKGYDPATSFGLYGNASDGLLDEAMAAIYLKPEDRKACQELLEAVYPGLLPGGNRSPLHPEPAEGWEQRLRDWFQGRRPVLRYDPARMHFAAEP
jgi:hypothetical protein